MTDINPLMNEILSEFADVSNEFPDAESRFPLITVTEISNISERIADGVEILSDVVIQIDVWDKLTDEVQTRQRCEKISSDVSGKLIKTGFKRIFAQNINEEGILRKCMRFSGQLDEKRKMIYRR